MFADVDIIGVGSRGATGAATPHEFKWRAEPPPNGSSVTKVAYYLHWFESSSGKVQPCLWADTRPTSNRFEDFTADW